MPGEHPPRREPCTEHEAGDGGLVGEFGHEDQAEDRGDDGEVEHAWPGYLRGRAAPTSPVSPGAPLNGPTTSEVIQPP